MTEPLSSSTLAHFVPARVRFRSLLVFHCHPIRKLFLSRMYLLDKNVLLQFMKRICPNGFIYFFRIFYIQYFSAQLEVLLSLLAPPRPWWWQEQDYSSSSSSMSIQINNYHLTNKIIPKSLLRVTENHFCPGLFLFYTLQNSESKIISFTSINIHLRRNTLSLYQYKTFTPLNHRHDHHHCLLSFPLLFH